MRSYFQGSQVIHILVKSSHYSATPRRNAPSHPAGKDATLPHVRQEKAKRSRSSRAEVRERHPKRRRRCGSVTRNAAGGAGASGGVQAQASAGSSYFGNTGAGAGSSVPAAI